MKTTTIIVEHFHLACNDVNIETCSFKVLYDGQQKHD